MRRIKAIIWDWNGTLLNDVDICIQSINRLLQQRSFPLLDKKLYKELFTFPVRNYYEQIGFDFNKEDWEIVAIEFIEIYQQKIKESCLFPDVEKVLKHFYEKEILQVVLSAMEQKSLVSSMQYFGIESYFYYILGITNHFAESKQHNSLQLLRQIKTKPSEVCLVGDTIHDYEVAREIGCQCVLIANGHQSEERLKTTGIPVISTLSDLINYF